jgi:hypothetical protein
MPSDTKLYFYKIHQGIRFFYKTIIKIINILVDNPFKTLILIFSFYLIDYLWQLKAAIAAILILAILFFGPKKLLLIFGYISNLFSSIKIDSNKIFSAIKSFYNFLIKPVNDLAEHPFLTLFLIIIFYFIDYFWQFKAAFFVTLFLICAFFRWSSKIFLGFGLMFIFISPILLLKLKIAEVDIYATYGYYFLFIGTLLQIIYYSQDKIQLKKIHQAK